MDKVINVVTVRNSNVVAHGTGGTDEGYTS